ncbi:MAG TPA: magnesium-protoporphyrin IX monomethyl ester anaerobic oxidative cyclase [Flavobacteriales bacterium]|nr:magnesium-protoporphyrin IX monomethyl ester anaerobic oxidative cyclase [Flavobacteriales bacterium]HRE73737.1 magnesium-protoporphyrin IX monomethyl ester anaerobic oxidative cyclase [Flavobacteriales bacterium]HRE96409.1 magnesium-protoporphyrin IX monomethyl ester anaerobic oxidative cyclase [Flavobacteriales bacterium]HRJ34458.1 magnesium-protoporphyrin IX monomethyl ester anaerobic oxidative cyclase [Flavobacteriales bacterium]HRJ37543.1 magnesium-protoporphyrin IX monomethyl ester ana
MKILLVNPPHLSIGSRMPKEHLPPLGLLSIGGPLIDAGNEVQLLDADFYNYKIELIVSKIKDASPDMVLLGHSGSTSAQPIIEEITRKVKAIAPQIITIIGGVFPTYHWKEILEDQPHIDFIVCGEGEQVILDLTKCIAQQNDPETVKGIAYQRDGIVVKTSAAPTLQNLDDYRIGWELMKGYQYTYWGKRKAVVVQFSRGCPYPCTYCGQSLFWKKWRHRSPQSLADEMEMLHRNYGIEVFNFADENPSSNPKAWRAFLEALIVKKMKIILVGSIRADNIVRDAEFLHLYKQAGFERFLLGIENYDEVVLEKIKKAGTVSKDKEAIRLLRQHNILSMATYVVGFGEERTRDFYNSLKQLLDYDPDQIQLLYATPHKWTPYFEEVKDKTIILTDQRKWDYKHQVLATEHLQPWHVILYVKLIEIIMQTRPKAIKRLLFHKEKRLRSAMRWYTRIGRRVWFWELWQFFFVTPLNYQKVKLREFWR